MVDIHIIPLAEIRRVRDADLAQDAKLGLIADICRLNTIATVKRAGSGHLGSSFSATDILTLLYFELMNTVELGWDHPERDIFFSSKGHDVPGTYSVFFAAGELPKERFVKLRRIDGTTGHPDVSIPGIETNSGSLGMGISKGKGMAFAKRLRGHGGHVYVMTGDGELQEGQIYESLPSAVGHGLRELTVIVDHNKVQSDQLVSEISDLGDIGARFAAFGWKVGRCDGHDFAALREKLAELRAHDGPGVLIADTIKGRGISFMEHPIALETNKGFYPWHAGAPADEPYRLGHAELVARINDQLAAAGLAELTLELLPPEEKPDSAVTKERVADAYGEALADLGDQRDDLVVLDADLTADCRLQHFKARHPERFIQHGIAEQDMASVAGGLALQGFLPVVNTFASFLCARANEQIYNNATERTKIVYVCHYAGLIPAGPGHSHQSVRDISTLASLPDIVIVQPCNAEESKALLDYCVNTTSSCSSIRLAIGPSPRRIELPAGYAVTEGKGCVLHEGDDAVLFAYGPVMLHEALSAAEQLASGGFGLRVVNTPFLNRFDAAWLSQVVGDTRRLFALDDHSPIGGMGDHLLNALWSGRLLEGRTFEKLGVEGVPACGTPSQALGAHGLDAASLATRVKA